MRKILKASAGTGKTYRLSLEYVAALLKGQSFQEIVVMTFSRKATAEIRERIFAHLAELLAQGKDSQVYQNLQKIYPELVFKRQILQQNYTSMLKNKDSLHIYTIDSFFNRIFRQAIAPYLGIYRYEIIEANENTQIAEKVFKTILANPEDFALIEKFLSDNTERKIEHYLELIEEILQYRWLFLLMEAGPREKLAAKDFVPYLDEAIYYYEEISKAKGKGFEDFLVKDFKNLLPEYLELREWESKRDFILQHRRLFLGKTFWNKGKVKGKKLAQLNEELINNYEHFRSELAKEIFNQEMIPYEEEILKFSARIFEIYDQIKFKEKAFTHNDISNYTYKYLKEGSLNLLVGERFSDYFFQLLGTEIKSLYIDEFQDTSILQWKILKPLVDSCENFIAVGDEKQSIYGWRGGEKELFSHLEEILGGETESLTTSYRSEKAIIDFVNRFFLSLDCDWDYGAVDYLQGKSSGYVEILLGGEALKTNTETNTFRKMSAAKQEELKELNAKIKGDLKREIALRIKELPDYSKVAVLARSNRELADIALELDKEKIPYLLESKDSLIDHPAVKPLYFLLEYLNYNDYLALLKFLRSDLVGISNQELKYLLQQKREVEAFLQDRSEKLAQKELRRVLKEIKELRILSYQELSNKLIEKTGVIKLYQDNTGALKNIFYFFKLMRQFSSLAAFMSYLEEKQQSKELRQIGVKEEQGVKLMTIHKAKGLSFETEFFYWKPSGENKTRSTGLELFFTFTDDFMELKDYLLTHGKFLKLFDYLGYNFVTLQKEKRIFEEINNVYVALTRPEKNLFLFIEGPRKLDPNKPGENWQDNDSYGFYESALLAATGVDSLAELVEGKKLGQLLVEKGEEIEEKMELPELRDYFQVSSPEEELAKINRQKEFQWELELGISRLKGLAIHYFLEHIKYNTAAERDYGRKMTWTRFGNILGPAGMQEVISRVEKFLKRYSWVFARRWQVFTEYEIQAGDRLYRIDRLLVDKEAKEILILDYKSGQSREEVQLEEYQRLVKERVKDDYKIRATFLEV